MAKYYIFYADKYSDTEWDDDYGGNTGRFLAARDALAAACTGTGTPTKDIILGSYRIGVFPDVDERLSLTSVGIAKTPQMVFTAIDPTTAGHFTDGGGNFIALAKLVQGQITRKNMEIMLKTIRDLKPRTDPDTGKVVFYDPSFRLFPNASIGFNPANAPGGNMIGLGLYENLTLDRVGQIVDKILDILKKALPFIVVGGAVLYISRRRKRK